MKDSSQNYFSHDHNFHSLVAEVRPGYLFFKRHNMKKCPTNIWDGVNVSWNSPEVMRKHITLKKKKKKTHKKEKTVLNEMGKRGRSGLERSNNIALIEFRFSVTNRGGLSSLGVWGKLLIDTSVSSLNRFDKLLTKLSWVNSVLLMNFYLRWTAKGKKAQWHPETTWLQASKDQLSTGANPPTSGCSKS